MIVKTQILSEKFLVLPYPFWFYVKTINTSNVICSDSKVQKDSCVKGGLNLRVNVMAKTLQEIKVSKRLLPKLSEVRGKYGRLHKSSLLYELKKFLLIKRISFLPLYVLQTITGNEVCKTK